MADKKISALTGATTPLAGTEVLPIVQSSATVKVAVSDLTAGRAISATQLTLTTGNLIVSDGKGIDFSATPGTGTSELLADYEEGTWTPSPGGGLTVVGAFTSYGYYTKIGRQVTVFGSISGATSVTATSGTVMCGNLPFAVVIPGVGAANSNTSVTAAASEIYSNANVGPGATIIFSCTYFV